MKNTMNNNNRNIQNTRDGYHLNSKYWQDWKKNIPMIGDFLFQVSLGMILSDATMYRVSRDAMIKFEQGAKQKEFLFHLFSLFEKYCFMTEPGIRVHNNGPNKGQIKSYWFKTFSHISFSAIWDLLFINNKKTISANIVKDHLTVVGLAYWIMGDGSLHREGRVLTLHTEGFIKDESTMLSDELNVKFGFHTKVVASKQKYHVIQFSTKDANKLHDMIIDLVIPSMKYKVPRKVLYMYVIDDIV